MGVHFTEVEMGQLVEIYKNYDCLWNMQHHLYRDNEARQTAYKEIVKRMNIPNLTAKDIPNKIKNLRSSYYQEIKRIKRSVRTCGTVYKPKVSWFTTVNEFLSPFVNERSFVTKNSPKVIKTNNKKDTSNKVQKEIEQIDKIAETISPSNSKTEDEFDSFGTYIATSLRSMPPEFSIIAKTELQKAISEIQLKILRQTNAASQQDQSSYCSASSDYENQHTRCMTPTSDSDLSNIKIEYEN